LIPLPLPRPPSGLLRGKRVIVTAAAGSGIGSATARRCLEEGARVLLSDRHAKRLDGIRRDFLLVHPGAVFGCACDVTREEDVLQLFSRAEAEMGGFDVLVNNAGLGHAARLVETADSDWQRVLDVTLTGTFRCLRAALRRLRAQSSGAIVNVSSVTAHRAEQGQSAYAAAKAGVLALTRCAAVEAAEYGVRVNAVVPTLAMHPHLARVASTEYLEEMIALQPQGRPAQPTEVADAIVFLASDLSSYLTGESLSISGQQA
jgi:3-oxoacyl-[acyl-carrier protein] reductase